MKTCGSFSLLSLAIVLFIAAGLPASSVSGTLRRLYPSSYLSIAESPRLRVSASPLLPFAQSQLPEYLWYEAENMRGLATDQRGEPILNPSWHNYGKAKAPGWGINGPGASAEWSQGGESEWNSVAASADETRATIYQDIEVPRAGDYKVWVRYADWSSKTENFTIRLTQDEREIFQHEFGLKDLVAAHDEISMYWGWAFTWDGVAAKLDKGPARISIDIEKAAGARRHVDAVLITNDLFYLPEGRRKPDFAGMRYLRQWSTERTPLTSLVSASRDTSIPISWQRPRIAGRDFLMPWNISKEFWPLYDKPAAERPLYPFHAEPIDQFVAKYKGERDVPIFASRLVVPVVYIPNLPEFFKEGSPFLRYLRETRAPFAILINYGAAQFPEGEGERAWKLLNGELRDQFLGWISGESVGYVWDSAVKDLKTSPGMTRNELLEAYRRFYTNALDKKWGSMFQTPTGPMWDKLIPAQATSSTSFAHALAAWGVCLLGMETAAVQPMFAMRIAFTRGAARQYGVAFLYYHAPNFGDTATTFTSQQNFAGPDNFFHSRYGATMGPSLSWYRKSYYLYYMAGASAIYLEQGFDQFFKPGPGEHPFQLNPLGRITDEFMRFAEKHPDRGTPYTPVAFLLDQAHGFEMTDYPHWPFGVSQINRSDRALREMFGVAYYPGLVVEGEPATADRQVFVNGVFGDIFDVLVASEVQSPRTKVQRSAGTATVPPADASSSIVRSSHIRGSESAVSPRYPVSAFPRRRISASPLSPYRAVVVGGHLDWTSDWISKLTDYLRNGGTVVLNAAQVKGLPEQLLGVRLTSSTAEADTARCLSSGEQPQDLTGQLFRYTKLELQGATTLIAAPGGDPLVTVNKLGKGSVVFSALPDLLGADERVTPFAAHMLAHVFSDATPVKVRGDVEYLINRANSGWVVTLFNNNGVHKPQQGLAQVDRSASITTTITIPGQPIRTAIDWISDRPLEVKRAHGDIVTVTLPPGGVAVVELK
ncbi:MAG: hypothetical protein M3410_11520 [Acidobacteriota bacterium]|nr:hypothetical protein [Acidobacteriota bacterium]